MRRTLACCLILAGLLLSAIQAFAIPNVMPYQGRLTDAAGNPLNGSQSVVFAIYTVASGGASIYSETQSVTVANGIFNVNIGSVTPIPATVWNNNALFLGIKVGTDAEMTPRQTLGTMPFAQKSADGAGVSHRRLTSITGSTIAQSAGPMASVSINAPAPGFAYVSAGGWTSVSHTNGSLDEWYIQVATTSGANPTFSSPGCALMRVDPQEYTGFHSQQFHSADVFPVVAGSNTFFLVGRKFGSGATTAGWGSGWLSAVYVPNLLGTSSEPQTAPTSKADENVDAAAAAAAARK